jgi:hypothetical protein
MEMPGPHRLKNGNWIDLERICQIIYKYNVACRKDTVLILLDGGNTEIIEFDNPSLAESYRDELGRLWTDAVIHQSYVDPLSREEP